MRVILLSFSLLLSITAFGQNKWEYGINVNFNSAFVKPVSADTFTNKPGFGAGLMLERKFKSFDLQLNPAFSQTSYLHEFDNFTSISNAMDVSLLGIIPIDKSKQTFINFGPIASYNFTYEERYLNTQKMPIKNTLIESKPLDIGVQFGVALDLNQGTRLNVLYTDFFNGKQTSGAITGQIDYLQIGVQVRFVDLLSSERTNSKHTAEQLAINTANQQVKDLGKDGNGLLIFVVGTSETQKSSLFNSKSPELKDSLRKAKLQNIKNAIRSEYKFGRYVITTDSLFDIRAETLMVLTADSTEKFLPLNFKKYYALIDELFLESNGQLKSGIFIYDEQMNQLKHPFPFFTPYRELDQNFSEVGSMIMTFNQSLEQYGIVID
jgi:hypothetical protein